MACRHAGSSRQAGRSSQRLGGRQAVAGRQAVVVSQVVSQVVRQCVDWLVGLHSCNLPIPYPAPLSFHLPAHVLDSILVSKPVAAFDCVVRMPPPVIHGHVP